MPELKNWPLISEYTTLSTPVFEVRKRLCLSPKDGREKNFILLKAPEWVNIMPLTSNDEVLLVRQFRHGSREFSLELPGGVVEPGQTPLMTGQRELMEETGYSAKNWRLLASLKPNPALFDNHIHTFIATDIAQTGQTSFDENEDLELVKVHVNELGIMIKDGRIDHALMVAAIGLFLATKI